MTDTSTCDGIHGPVPPQRMRPSARKLRDIYARTPGAPLFQREFGFYCLDRWYRQGLDRGANLAEVFGYDPPGHHPLRQLGWCEAAFVPAFEGKVLEDRGRHEVVQDVAGRAVLCFKGRRSGFMPEYLDHPVKNLATWNERCLWRLNPHTPQRCDGLAERMADAAEAAGAGLMIQQGLIGGYMYLRSLMGPLELLYAFHDQPELIHACMEAWLALADAVIARHQRYVTLDEVFFAEDICYNHGPLISPDMMRRFLLPYYQQLVTNIRRRQLDPTRHLYVQVDTDGYAPAVIDLYRDAIGMDVMSPFEVAAGCDVVAVGRQWPDLVLTGGIDKRILAAGCEAIDRHVDAILPVLHGRGGYIPTCDHGVPEEVPLTNYRHYRRRCMEFA
jgi:uroporphyrinogen decarboxylase